MVHHDYDKRLMQAKQRIASKSQTPPPHAHPLLFLHQKDLTPQGYFVTQLGGITNTMSGLVIAQVDGMCLRMNNMTHHPTRTLKHLSQLV